MLLLRDKDFVISLIDFNANEEMEKTHISHLKFKHHVSFELLTHAWAISYKDKIINIQTYNKKITVSTFFDVESMLKRTFFEALFP